MTEDAAHQTKGKERDWTEDEVMNLKRTGGVKNEMTAQGMCTTFKRTKGGEEDSTRCLRYSIPQEFLVCLFGERHSFPSNIMCCVCGGVLVFPELLVCAQTMLVCRRGIRGTRRLERGNSISMDMETDTMACEKIPNGVRDVTKMKTSRNMSIRLLQSRQKLSLRLNVQDSWDSQARLRTS